VRGGAGAAADGPAGPVWQGTGTVVVRAVRVISYPESRAGGLYRDGADPAQR